MIFSIQYLRGLAAIMVVLYHIEIKGRQYDINNLSWFKIGFFGVDLFFIISAFIMCNTTYNKNTTFTRFIGARITRILPLYWLMTLLALIIFLIKPSLVNSSGGVTSIWASFLLAPNGDKFLVNNGWTLSYEFLFYFIFGLSLILPLKNKRLIISSILIFIVSFGYIVNFDSTYYDFITDPILLEFLLGIIAFTILKKYNIPAAMSYTLIFSAIIILLWENNFGAIHLTLGRAVSAGIPMFLLFIGIVRFEDKIKQKTNILLKGIEKLGDSSYSLYLVHPFILSPGAIIAKKIGLVNHPNLFSIFLLLLSVAGGWLCYHYIEKPINHKLKIHTAKRRNIKNAI